jgi:uncharacterized protein YbjQ (UPF0145 family)
MIARPLAFALLGLASGCASQWAMAAGPGSLHWAASIDAAPAPAPSPVVDPALAARVQLVPGMPERICEVIGFLEGDAPRGSGDAALAELRARAAALGADAVVHVRLHEEDSVGAHSVSGDPAWEAMLDGDERAGASVMHLTGEAVRYRDAIRGRDYHVIARIRVSDRLGRETEAFQRLAARARALRADLVIDVEVTRAAPTRPFELHGTAIRFLR